MTLAFSYLSEPLRPLKVNIFGGVLTWRPAVTPSLFLSPSLSFLAAARAFVDASSVNPSSESGVVSMSFFSWRQVR
eukprot:CAMPEP_0118967944 /NCGR_PEP_ID=MMETSP1173-20130426/5254_1 /TAXON_ID=1034831 /ORGANISM="Rhizochromulina marina cf, Strain CCMP1243" /LENGTH=75 /DNA_ID=CAMNT_0006916987 /DNA_START=87 /DNA_END=314 /DNA_ORIENTATION=-